MAHSWRWHCKHRYLFLYIIKQVGCLRCWHYRLIESDIMSPVFHRGLIPPRLTPPLVSKPRWALEYHGDKRYNLENRVFIKINFVHISPFCTHSYSYQLKIRSLVIRYPPQITDISELVLIVCDKWLIIVESRSMMTSSNGNIFRATSHLCGEFTGPQRIPRTTASDAEVWYFLWYASE